MTNTCRTAAPLLIATLSVSLLVACASSPDIDTRPAPIMSAEKSLELGVSNYDENNFAKAEAHFDRALFLYRNIDNPEGITASCLNIAKTKLASGRIKEAQAYTDQAQTIIQHEQLTEYEDRLTLIKTSIAIEDGNLEEAKQMLGKLLAAKTTSNKPLIEIAALQNRTRAAFLLNADDAGSWVEKYKTALKNSDQDSRLNRARLLRFEAALEPVSSMEKLNEALTLYRKAAHGPGIAATLSELAKLDLKNANYEDATNKLERALFIRLNLHDRKNSQKALQQLSSSYSQLGKTNKSERANYWQKELDSKFFEEWGTISFELESYPR